MMSIDTKSTEREQAEKSDDCFVSNPLKEICQKLKIPDLEQYTT